ncbi:type I secretion C-terminal target domain-containing protein, partial [Mesorhizobium sp. CU2]|uniref:beta strand repeat-containing protein n=1 Tax=Mesorhizobium sp. CU2 TaxID=2589985 RepID=UPI00112B3289
FTYSYTLGAAQTHPAGNGNNTLPDSVSVAVDGIGGTHGEGTINIVIVDDVPVAHDVNAGTLTEDGATTTVSGNVSTDYGNVFGADGPAASGSVAWGAVSATLNGGAVNLADYGTLTENANGTWSFVLDNSKPATQALNNGDAINVSLGYTLTDHDSDADSKTITFTINGADDTSTVVVTPSDDANANGAASVVYEHGLTSVPDTSETDTGAFKVTATDGIKDVTIGGQTLALNAWLNQTINTSEGTLKITGVTVAPDGKSADFTYSYTLGAAQTHPAGNGNNTLPDSVSVAVDGIGGTHGAGSVNITIVDDIPKANADTGNVTEGALLQVNAANGVLSNDVSGADGYAAGGGVVGVRAANGDTTTAVATGINTQIVGQYGTLTLQADGSYSYKATANAISSNATDTFVYTVKDGDGDTSTTTLTINVANVTLAPVNQTGQVNEAALDLTKDPTDLAAGTVTGSTPASTAETVTGQLTVAGTGIAYTPISQTTAHGVFELQANGAWTYTLTTPFNSGAVQGANTVAGAESFTYTATDANGNTVQGTVKIDVVDDIPTLGTVQSQQASNDPLQAPAVGTLHFSAGADGAGAAMTITANTTGITSGGHNLITEQVGNVLTAYADNNNNGSHDAGDTAVFTITVNPNAGTSGQYTFDLLAPLDGTVSNVSIASSGSYGSGPSNSIVVTAGGQNVVMVTGWAPAGGFNEANWLAGGNPALTQTSNVNGSNAGWGLGNNNFDAGEFMRFDFGTPNDYDGAGAYVPPAITIASVSYAKFTFDAVSASDKIEFVAHYTNGSTASFIPTTGATSLTINSPAGLQIAWVDAYESSGKTKLNLTDLGVSSTTVDHTIPVTLQLTDGDGDKTGTANFTVHVAAGLTPFTVAAPVVLDLNHDGIHTTDLTHSTVSFDYNGDGVASKTAWVDSHDGILAIDLNGDGKVNNGSEIVFTQHVAGAATDLAALEQLYDTNHDGKLTAADHDFSKFGVWQDANGNGVADAGEFKSLATLGIVEIGLESNHQQSISADGSVVTYGEATFTTADGQTGAVADIGFGNYDGAGSGGNSTLAGTSGADTFKIENLNIKDLISDYHGSEGDKVDLSALFEKAPAGNIADYVHYNSATSTVSVDTSGSGNPANFVDVAVLQNAPAAGTINILYDDSNHQQHTATI